MEGKVHRLPGRGDSLRLSAGSNVSSSLAFSPGCIRHCHISFCPILPDGEALLKPGASFCFQFWPVCRQRRVISSNTFESVRAMALEIQAGGGAVKQFLSGGQGLLEILLCSFLIAAG